MPASTRSRVPPSNAASATPSCRAARSHAAISTAAFAIGWPRKARSNTGNTSSGPAKDRASTAGATQVGMASQAVSTVSGAYPGVSWATHSPHPVSPSGPNASTSRMRRSSVVPDEVRNGSRRVRAISRSTSRSRRIPVTGRAYPARATAPARPGTLAPCPTL
jgi:hypothetical protein